LTALATYRRAWRFVIVPADENRALTEICDRACLRGDAVCGMSIFSRSRTTAQPTKEPLLMNADIVKDLAPTGKLRATINLGNMVLAQGTPDAPRGVTVDLSRELAKRLGVPVEFTCFDAAGKAFDTFKAGGLDIIFLAIEPVRANEIAFTEPYVLIEGVYMVGKDSPIKSKDDIDRAGIRIGVNLNSAYDLFLTRTLKAASLVRGDDGIELFVKQGLEAAAGVRQPMAIYAKGHPEVRLLDGRFMEIRQAVGTAKGRDAGAAYLRAFVEEMKANGFVADALKRSNQPDAAVAPPAR
jgi:polar amino acid transport system substrate-binding protein